MPWTRAPLRKSSARVVLCALVFLLAGPAAARSAAPLGEIARNELPSEARATLQLITRGGPFPYRKDGVVFDNREHRLPPHHGAYYREYTVPTPGARDRGAQRIISGQQGEYYYSDDHYRTFRRIRE